MDTQSKGDAPRMGTYYIVDQVERYGEVVNQRLEDSVPVPPGCRLIAVMKRISRGEVIAVDVTDWRDRMFFRDRFSVASAHRGTSEFTSCQLYLLTKDRQGNVLSYEQRFQ